MNKHQEVRQQRNQQKIFCQKCGNTDRQYVVLQCHHTFCILCLAFMHIKCRVSVLNQSSIKCIQCNFISELNDIFIDLINKTIKEQVIPSLEPTEIFTTQNKMPFKNIEKSHFIQTIDRKIKSQEHSFENITPSTTKYFFSKCESPSSLKKRDSRRFCKHHSLDEISYLCLSCEGQTLCVKCISSNKKHANHEVKDLQKAIQIIKEQLSYSKFDITAKIDNMEMCQRRIEDSCGIVRAKGLKRINDIKFQFNELSKRLKEKQNEIIKIYESQFENIHRNLNTQNEQISYRIDLLRNHLDNMVKIEKQNDHFEFLAQYRHIKNANLKYLYQSPTISLEKLAEPQSTIQKQIAELSQKISSIQILHKEPKQNTLQNCRSESKMRKDKSYKRVRTNLGSLNSSRDKKQKKYTKTEEDEKRVKHDKLFKNQKRNSGKIPAYINDFISKKNNKCGSGASSYVLEMTGNMQNSKMASKLSKTIIPEEIKKKKEHVAVIKERIQRKTVHPNFRSQKTGESTKKKRNH